MTRAHIENPDWRFVTARLSHLIAFGFGSGLVPRLPGTAGTVLALTLYLALAQFLSQEAILGLTALGFIVGAWAASDTEKSLSRDDFGGIVIDEIIAFWLVLIFIPQSPWWYASAFVLFRLFDILKPWPIRFFDRHIPGGFGIMFDDLLAASYTLLTIEIGVRALL